MGLTKEGIKERGLNVHAWRHFCNTEMLNAGIPVKKVQAVTRHKSERMTERYTHFNPLDFAEVFNLQAELLKKKPKKPVSSVKDGQDRGSSPATAADERPALTLVKMPEKNTAARKKQAS
jgi:hypothetical protein